ncbi:MAG TPA: M24B family metallopeptidase, partial [Clostridiaceae bacterium]|nr:M24B family metallopeptidase [Clostridiaceae bacterium]
EEIEKIRKAIEITKNGIYNLMKNAQPGMKEYELEAYYDFVLKSSGVKDFAFDTICASGHNATVLHYVANDAKVLENELVLLDLGAAYEYYSADISRTFPVSGKFTERQKTFYNLVLEAQQAAIDALKPGLPFAEINKIVLRVYAEGLKAIGLIDKDEDVRKYYYHNTSHHLGLNTHDVGSRDLDLEEGMVITIEPGLYISDENIGIRIEEDVLITKDGCEVLSKDIIKSVEEIEAFLTHSKLVRVK